MMKLITEDTTKPKSHFLEQLSPWVGKAIIIRNKNDCDKTFRRGTIRSLDGDFIEGYSPSTTSYGVQKEWLYLWYEFEAGVPE